MDSDVPKKMSGLFNAFKSSVAKTKKLNPPELDKKSVDLLLTSLRSILSRSDIETSDSDRISLSMTRLINAMDNRHRLIKRLIERLSHPTVYSKNQLNTVINSYFGTDFTIEGALKLTAASQAIAIFKKLKEITLSVIFTTTRNFSIQKNLSISA